MKNKEHRKFDINLLEIVVKKFEFKGLNVKNKKSDDFTSKFNRFCSMLSCFNKEEQELILELFDKYIWLHFKDYYNLLMHMLEDITPDQLKEFNNIYVLPLIAPEDEYKRNKGSHLVHGLLRETDWTCDGEFANKKVHVIDNFNTQLPANFDRGMNLLLLVEDFIGTGDTAISAITHLENQIKIDKSKIMILSLHALKRGLIAVNNFGVNVVVGKELFRGISDNKSLASKKNALKVMEAIEKTIKISSDLRFGYKKSEALVTMHRTPNNTFPVFWKKHNMFDAPFMR